MTKTHPGPQRPGLEFAHTAGSGRAALGITDYASGLSESMGAALGITDYASGLGITDYASALGITDYASGLSESMGAALGITHYASGLGITDYASGLGITDYASGLGITDYASGLGITDYASALGITDYASGLGITDYASGLGITDYASGLSESMGAALGITDYASGLGITDYASGLGITDYASGLGITDYASGLGITDYASGLGITDYASALGITDYASGLGITEPMRTALGDLPAITRIARSGFTENALWRTAHRIDSVSLEDVLDGPGRCEGRADGTRGQHGDRSGLLSHHAADTEALPVLMVLVSCPSALVDGTVTAVGHILQQYWFALRILGAVAQVEPAIAGLSLVITAVGVKSWLLGSVDRR